MLYCRARCFEMLRRIRMFCFLLSIFFLTAFAAQAQESGPTVIKEKNVMIPMRDGVRLAANIFRPDASEKFTTVLSRTPYGKVELQAVIEALALRGYAGVCQDARGRFDSEGAWEPFFNESRDGYDTIEWIAGQPWSNGDVIMIGGSYSGLVQWLAAKERSPHLKGLITIVTPGDFYEDFVYEGGAFLLGAGAMWSAFVDGRQVNFTELIKARWDKAFTTIPVSSTLKALGRDPKYYRDWIAHPNYDQYWRRISWDKDFPNFDFAVLHIGGWYDIFQKGTIENFRRMTTRARAEARGRQHLIIGPWGHQGQNISKVGEMDFGPQSRLDNQIILDWIEHYFGAKKNARRLAAVRVFTTGENKWNEYEAWPVPDARRVDYYFHSHGKANSASGDGSLSLAKPSKGASPDRFVYDPANPVPTRGGNNCCWPQIIPWGPFDQREVEQRQDVLVYTTPPLEEDLRVTGPVEIKLWAASSATDTDFTGKLVDVAPDGLAINLTEGIQRAVYRKSFSKPEPLTPGAPTEMAIDLWNTSHVFKKGHRIMVEISSSNFPRYSRNFNTGRQPETETEMKKAQQTVFHDLRRPSRITLPVLSR
ncbi:MAG: CocE/NonD family hydrolase [Acidobacteriota bacterium]